MLSNQQGVAEVRIIRPSLVTISDGKKPTMKTVIRDRNGSDSSSLVVEDSQLESIKQQHSIVVSKAR